MNSLQQKLSNIAGVIVDLDGTMAHTAPDFQVAINAVRRELDLPGLSIELIETFVGKGTAHLVRRALAVDLTSAQVDVHFEQALDRYHAHYHAINGQYVTIYDGVQAGLSLMQQKGLRLACVTNKPIAFAVPLLQKLGLEDYFEVVYGGDSFPKKKPDPYPLLQVCKDFDVPPQRIVAIGDSINDAQAARAAGCWVLNVPYGYNHGHPIQEVDSDGIVQTLLEAAELISPQS
ncbi:phosphoglycolate phosphatase [Oxalobacteraceae bacterium R-40]|uniref:Phosphoglycolate phosphatase n=1 Tax=Keguizhuia sedimenti TaxID=3064264 RepID=A0ABU1BPZ9_9BURK|nr:phosphoglycolate phosphatase [Oxalobacteraceae bacterium R-40]